jgi:hypothetical protein
VPKCIISGNLTTFPALLVIGDCWPHVPSVHYFRLYGNFPSFIGYWWLKTSCALCALMQVIWQISAFIGYRWLKALCALCALFQITRRPSSLYWWRKISEAL